MADEWHVLLYRGDERYTHLNDTTSVNKIYPRLDARDEMPSRCMHYVGDVPMTGNNGGGHAEADYHSVRRNLE